MHTLFNRRTFSITSFFYSEKDGTQQHHFLTNVGQLGDIDEFSMFNSIYTGSQLWRTKMVTCKKTKKIQKKCQNYKKIKKSLLIFFQIVPSGLNFEIYRSWPK